MTNVLSARLHRPCAELKLPRLSIPSPTICLDQGERMQLHTRRIYQARLFAIFYDADTGGDASVSLAAREAYLHMTLHAAIGGMGIRGVLFCWNDVLLSWM